MVRKFVSSAICLILLYMVIMAVLEFIAGCIRSVKRKLQRRKINEMGIHFQEVALHPRERNDEKADSAGCGVPDAEAPASAPLPFEPTEAEEEVL